MHEVLVNRMRNGVYLGMLHSRRWSSEGVSEGSVGQEALASDSRTEFASPQVIVMLDAS